MLLLLLFGVDLPDLAVAADRIVAKLPVFVCFFCSAFRTATKFYTTHLCSSMAVELEPVFHALLEHQKYGLQWLVSRERSVRRAGFGGVGGGGILGDDMGMGKTLQILALVSSQACRENEASGEESISAADAADSLHGPTLIVCPQSVLHNWKRETARWLGWHETSAPFCCVLISRVSTLAKARCGPDQGSPVFTRSPIAAREGESIAMLCQATLVITSYETVDCDYHGERVLQRVFWRRVVLDEAHRIRNAPKSSECLYALRSWSRWACTGTLFHNGMDDVANVARFLAMHPYDRASWWRRNKSKSAAVTAWKGKFYLSRSKSILRLPPVQYETVYVKLTARLRRKYNAMLQGALMRYIAARKAAATRTQQQAAMSIVLGTIREMRQFCNHEHLASGNSGFAEHIEGVVRGVSRSKTEFATSKLGVVVSVCRRLIRRDRACKIVVFSQWKRTLDGLYRVLTSAHRVSCTFYHGSLTADEKQQQLDLFCAAGSSVSIMLVSLKAGGVGINLSCAQHVLMVDGWYNPFLETQAIDRVNRIGQTAENVTCYRFHVENSVEDDITNIQGVKRSAAERFYSGAPAASPLSGIRRHSVDVGSITNMKGVVSMIISGKVLLDGMSIHKVFGQLMRDAEGERDSSAVTLQDTKHKERDKRGRCFINRGYDMCAEPSRPSCRAAFEFLNDSERRVQKRAKVGTRSLYLSRTSDRTMDLKHCATICVPSAAEETSDAVCVEVRPGTEQDIDVVAHDADPESVRSHSCLFGGALVSTRRNVELDMDEYRALPNSSKLFKCDAISTPHVTRSRLRSGRIRSSLVE